MSDLIIPWPYEDVPWPFPTVRQMNEELGAFMGIQWQKDWYALVYEGIKRMQADPLNYGAELDIWKLADDRMARFRERFPNDVLIELDLGGNRASKTERAAKRLVEHMVGADDWRVWACQSTETASVQNQQNIIYKYLPNEWKPESGRLRHGATTKITYTQSGGFTENVLTCPNRSELRFKFYEMKVKNQEGAELDEAWGDELIPPDWIEAIIFRLITRAGKRPHSGIFTITFTPIEGYSSTVKLCLHGAKTIEEVDAELLPKRAMGDLGGPSRSLGMTEKEEEISAGDNTSIGHILGTGKTETDQHPKEPEEPGSPAGNFAGIPQAEQPCLDAVLSEVENTAAAEGPATRQNKPLMRNGDGQCDPARHGSESTKFEKVPRVQENLAVNINGQKAKALIIYFHTKDNPFGNYESMKATLEGASREKILTRAYGVPTKAMMTRFPLFSDLAHVISLNRFREIQKNGGTWYHFLDPCSGRNWFQLWILVDPIGRAFVAAESPSYDHEWAYIPGVGNPGPWAISGNKADGEQGDGQKEWGWGYDRYIEEIERMERLLAPPRPATIGQDPKGMFSSAESEATSAARIEVAGRWIDARYGNARRTNQERSTTTIEDLHELGIDFLAAPSEKMIDSGRGGGDGSLRMINDRLFYDQDRPIDFTNQPHLYVVETCPNTIYALKEWTGKDGQHGACKDPIDTLRMFVLSGSEHVDETLLQPRTPWMGQFQR